MYINYVPNIGAMVEGERIESYLVSTSIAHSSLSPSLNLTFAMISYTSEIEKKIRMAEYSNLVRSNFVIFLSKPWSIIAYWSLDVCRNKYILKNVTVDNKLLPTPKYEFLIVLRQVFVHFGKEAVLIKV